jgi:hypothetical protein
MEQRVCVFRSKPRQLEDLAASWTAGVVYRRRPDHNFVTPGPQRGNRLDQDGCHSGITMSPTAVVQLSGRKLELVRHPGDGQVLAFDDADDAFAFAVSLELAGATAAGTIEAPPGATLHMLAPGATAFDLERPMERAA